MKQYLILLLLFISVTSTAENAVIQGVITDKDQKPVANISIFVAGTDIGTTSDQTGFYKLTVPADQKITINFTSVNYQTISLTDIVIATAPPLEFNPVLSEEVTKIETVIVRQIKDQEFEGITTIKPKMLKKIPGVKPGVENLLKSLPGVSNNNELSSQYTVRGGNFDENLVYINEIEVYRPFLVRSGQQEGLSIVNGDMVRSVDFSAGGFQAKYGDKLSSVLDITYRRPEEFSAGVDASFLGVNAFVEGTAFAKALTK